MTNITNIINNSSNQTVIDNTIYITNNNVSIGTSTHDLSSKINLESSDAVNTLVINNTGGSYAINNGCLHLKADAYSPWVNMLKCENAFGEFLKITSDNVILAPNNPLRLSTTGNHNIIFSVDSVTICSVYSEGLYLHTGSYNTSDDRLKNEEAYITDAITTLQKLKPQTYFKVLNGSSSYFEAGLIAQEIYYDAPELRFLVMVPPDASGIETPPAGYPSSEPTIDPDYSNWGSTYAAVNYTGLIPYLIKGIQEQQEKINTLEMENNNLQTQINEQNTQISDILTRLSLLENN